MVAQASVLILSCGVDEVVASKVVAYWVVAYKVVALGWEQALYCCRLNQLGR